jgi:hypothetical protein
VLRESPHLELRLDVGKHWEAQEAEERTANECFCPGQGVTGYSIGSDSNCVQGPNRCSGQDWRGSTLAHFEKLLPTQGADSTTKLSEMFEALRHARTPRLYSCHR